MPDGAILLNTVFHCVLFIISSSFELLIFLADMPQRLLVLYLFSTENSDYFVFRVVRSLHQDGVGASLLASVNSSIV